MAKMISILHKGNDCYVVDAILIKEEPKMYTVNFQGKLQKWPRVNVDMIEIGKFAVKIAFFDIMNNQTMFIRTMAVKQVFNRNAVKIPRPRLRLGRN
jgi:hypothetical protein